MSDRKALIDRLRVGLMASAAFVRDSKSKDAQARMKDALDAFEEVSALLSQPSPSDEVRGLIEEGRIIAKNAASQGDYYISHNDPKNDTTFKDIADFANKAADAIARLSTPPSSPVSGEGDALRLANETADEIGHIIAGYDNTAERAAAKKIVAGWYELTAFQGNEERAGQDDCSIELRAEHFAKLGAIAALTRPPEGNARGLREALIEVNALIVRVIRRHESMETVDIRRLVERALALPVDDEAKGIAEMAREERALYPERYAVPDDEAKRIRAEVIEEAVKAVRSQNFGGAIANPIIAAIRALAQPEQGGAT